MTQTKVRKATPKMDRDFAKLCAEIDRKIKCAKQTAQAVVEIQEQDK